MALQLPKEIERLSQNHRALLDSLYEMVLLVGRNGAIEYVNPRGAELFDRVTKDQKPATVQHQLQQLIEELLRGDRRRPSSFSILKNLDLECRVAPFIGYNGDQLYWLLLRALDSRRAEHANQDTAETLKIVGSSNVIKNLFAIVDSVAKTDTTVLITGESGTGKELIAHLLRNQSRRSDKPFLTINCNTISDLLLESELFGYEKGSFTGANKQRKGKFEIADGGTIFLDEIGDISPRMQAALLRVLQNKEITRVGGHRPIKVDVRIVAATNRDLAAGVQNKTFRLDLFYRLSIINIHIPPLRDRKEDIPELTAHFIEKYNLLFNKKVTTRPNNIMGKLREYHWPGNIRELENVIHRAVLMCKTDDLEESDIIFDMTIDKQEKGGEKSLLAQRENGVSLKNILIEVEKEIIAETLKHDHGNVSKASESLEISKASLYEKIKRYKIPKHFQNS